MQHPEVLLIPILFACDHYLTLIAAKAAEQKYRVHFRVEHYELNPRFQETIAKGRWLSGRFLLAWFFCTVFFCAIAWMPDLPEELRQLVLGYGFGSWGTIIGRHIGNLLIYRYLRKHGDEIQGEVRLAHPLVLAISQLSLAAALYPLLLLLACLTGDLMVTGGALGVLMVIAVHGRWLSKARKVRSAATISGERSADGGASPSAEGARRAGGDGCPQATLEPPMLR